MLYTSGTLGTSRDPHSQSQQRPHPAAHRRRRQRCPRRDSVAGAVGLRLDAWQRQSAGWRKSLSVRGSSSPSMRPARARTGARRCRRIGVAVLPIDRSSRSRHLQVSPRRAQSGQAARQPKHRRPRMSRTACAEASPPAPVAKPGRPRAQRGVSCRQVNFKRLLPRPRSYLALYIGARISRAGRAAAAARAGSSERAFRLRFRRPIALAPGAAERAGHMALTHGRRPPCCILAVHPAPHRFTARCDEHRCSLASGAPPRSTFLRRPRSRLRYSCPFVIARAVAGAVQDGGQRDRLAPVMHPAKSPTWLSLWRITAGRPWRVPGRPDSVDQRRSNRPGDRKTKRKQKNRWRLRREPDPPQPMRWAASSPPGARQPAA